MTVRVVSAEVRLGARLRELARSRELLANLVRTEIKVKYKNSALGIAWTMVAPAITLAIYYFVFGVLLKAGVPDYVIYLASGLLVWNFFAASVLTGTGVIVGRAGIVKKVAFPREILSIATVGSQAVYVALQWIVLAALMVVFHHAPDWGALPLLVLAAAVATVFAAALAILLSAVNVYLRDTQHLIEVLIMAWFWATPVVYSYWNQLYLNLARSYPGWLWLRYLYLANPMTAVVLSFQRVLYAKTTVVSTTTAYRPGTGAPYHPILQQLPPWPISTYYALLAVMLIACGALLLGAIKIFGRLEGNFAEEL